MRKLSFDKLCDRFEETLTDQGLNVLKMDGVEYDRRFEAWLENEIINGNMVFNDNTGEYYA